MRAIIGLILIIVFVWITMLAGLVVIFASLPLLISTLSVSIGRIPESVVVTGMALIMVLVWLFIWKELAFKYFSRSLARTQTHKSD
jgi:hypothetical protein